MCQKLGFCSYTRCISLFISLFFFQHKSVDFIPLSIHSSPFHCIPFSFSLLSLFHSSCLLFILTLTLLLALHLAPLTTFSMIALPSLFLLFLSSCHPFFVKVPLSSFLSLVALCCTILHQALYIT